MVNPNRILLFYITDKSGHNRASLAIESALQKIEPSVETKNINFLQYTYPVLEKVFDKTYLEIIKRSPEIWDFLYDNTELINKTKKIKDFVNKLQVSKLKNLLSDFPPTCICCTQAFPCGVVSRLKKKNKLTIPLVAVITDYTFHEYWLYKNVDYYIVPSLNIKQRLIESGVLETRIQVLGIPVDPVFSLNTSEKSLLGKLDLNAKKPIVLIMGGNKGLGAIQNIVSSVLRDSDETQAVVVAGKNKKLYHSLQKTMLNYQSRLRVLGYMKEINELMDIADLIITKPGGLTTSEALVKSLPIVIVNPIPGHEERNAKYLEQSGVAIRCSDNTSVGLLVERVLKEESISITMREAAKKISKPNAANDIAQLLLKIGKR